MIKEMFRRTFFAVNLPSELKEKLRALTESVRTSYPSLSYVDVSEMHFTLHFLGLLDDAWVEKAKHILNDVAHRYPPMQLEIGDFSCFPHWQSPRVLFLNMREVGGTQLIALQKTLIEKLSALGIEPDYKPWRPHLTIARVKTFVGFDEKKLQSINTCYGSYFTVHSLELMESRLSRSGAKYEILYSVPLSSS